MAMYSGAHTRHEIKYHFVWCPKYRKMALKDEIGAFVTKLIQEVAERYDIKIEELAVMQDHVHMFVTAIPELSPAEIMRVVKSITAREVFQNYPRIKKMLWGGNLWARGYFVMTSGEGTTDEMIRRYIKEQRNE